MIKYLLLALTISVVCSNGFQQDQLKIERNVISQTSDDFKGSARHLLNRLVNILKDAFEKGIDTYEKVVNDEDVKAILEHLNSFQRKIAMAIINGFRNILKSIDTATKDQSKRDLKQSSAQLINKLVNLLKTAFEQGRETFDKVVNDEDVKAILNHLGPLSRKIAESIIQGFKDILDKIDNATKDQSQVSKRSVEENSQEIIFILVTYLESVSKQGRDAFEKAVNSWEVVTVLNELDPYSRKFADSLIDQYRQKSQSQIRKRDVRETTSQLVNKLVKQVKSNIEEGQKSYERVANDEDVKAILNHLGPLSKKVINVIKDILDEIDDATKDSYQRPRRDLKESSTALINKLIRLLKTGLEQGREAFEKVLNDEDVKGILEHLGPLSRKVANTIIQGFKDILDKIDNATKDQSQLSKRDFKETSASLINKLVRLLKAGFEQGREAFDKVLNDEDVKAILEHLGPLSRRVADKIIQGFKDILEKIDQATNDQSLSKKRGIKESSAQLINKLVQILKNAFEQGRAAFDKVINDEDVKGILNHLGPLSRKLADSIIQGFKDILDRIDNATKNQSALAKRDIKDSTAHLINRLVNLLRQGFEGGRDMYEKVINDDDVKGILERLGPLSRKVAQSIINGFYDLLDKIDEATKGYVRQ